MDHLLPGISLAKSAGCVLMFCLAACSPPDEVSENSTPANGSMDGAGSEGVDPGQAYLHINARKPGVRVLESGLQIEILENGSGASPSLASTVETHYHGRFVDGTVFDSSVDRGQPLTFPVGGVIAGWTEALLMMKEGDRWRLVIPPQLAYGEKGVRGVIPPHSVLVFDVELIKVKQ